LTCPQCDTHAFHLEDQLADFGYRYHSKIRIVTPQSWCRACRSAG
jgi:hypothetical protein